MQIVNFRCGHCGQLLAVQAQFLGQQVRCPHCQKVVMAPSTPPVSPPAPAPASTPQAASLPAEQEKTLDATFEVKAPDEHESIFTAPTAADDVFGHSGQKIEMPTETINPPLPGPTLAPPSAPTAIPNLELASGPGMPPTMPPAPPDATLTYFPEERTEASVLPGNESTVPQAPLPLPWQPAPQLEPATATEEEPLFEREHAAASIQPRKRRGPLFAILFISLVSYSIGTTALIIVQYLRSRNHVEKTHPLEMLPDIDGEFPTNRKGTKKAVRDKIGGYERPSTRTPLSDRLKLKLGQTLTLGEVEVTPTRVERDKIRLREAGREQSEESREPALKLFLTIRNLSPDLAFHPMDRFFTRYHHPGEGRDKQRWQSALEPYSYLEIGHRRFYGGPAGYFDLADDPQNRAGWLNEYVVGQDFQNQLKPGDPPWETFVCTDPDDADIPKALERNKGEPLLWRVEIRRGSVMVGDRRVPCTAVFGVEFTDSDIQPPRKQG